MTTKSVFEQKELKVVATVDREPIQVREFKRELHNQRARVISYFKRTQNVNMSDSTTFWTDSYGGETPRDRIRDQALDSLSRIKIEQSVAKRQGVIEDSRYSVFLKDWIVENERRAEALSNNEVVYGPMQYKEDEYFEHVFSNMVIRTKELLGQGELAPTGEELRTYYERNKENYFNEETSKPISFEEAKTGLKHEYIDEEYEKLISSLLSTATIKINKKVYQNIEYVKIGL